MNPLKKQAQLAVLNGMIGRPTAPAVAPIGPLAGLKNKEQSVMRKSLDIPMSTGKGIKESLTKKIRPKGIKPPGM